MASGNNGGIEPKLPEVLATSQVFIKNTFEAIRNILQKCYVTPYIGHCATYDNSGPWDLGFCWIYAIYCPDQFLDQLESNIDYLDEIGRSLAMNPFSSEDKRPYGSVFIQPATLLLSASSAEKILFLERCYDLVRIEDTHTNNRPNNPES